LLANRAAVIAVLALLGATPLVRCSRLSLQRSGGASIAMAVVVDDSMSMRADAGGRSRFERARQGARELLASAREGDAIALVLAGAPARVALAATTDLGAARHAIDELSPNDLGTDLDGAIALARGLIASLPQVDRRIVVLSDLADGHAEGPALGESSDMPIWIALPELLVEKKDCGVLRADQRGARVRVEVACGPGQSATGREIVVEDASGKALGRAPLGGSRTEVVVLLPSGDEKADRVRLAGGDAVAADDAAPVVPEAARGAVAVVVDATDESVATGGAPIVEQALGALKLDVEASPIPTIPDRIEDLAGHLGVLLDDPPGLTPEQRHVLGAFIDAGGVVLVALGPHAASAPLGATLEPILTRPISWVATTAPGADRATAIGTLAESAQSLSDLSAARRATLSPEDAGMFEPLVRWTDGELLVARRVMGRGEVWLVTLPFAIDASDLTLRPAFLALLEAWVSAARDRAAPLRTEVGTRWKFPGAHSVEASGPSGRLVATREAGVIEILPTLVGGYRITVDGKTESRVAAPDRHEVDMRPRPVAAKAVSHGLGERSASVDVSGPVAVTLLALLTLEMALRLFARRRSEAT
jgi:von Willebrand factor type A domain